MSSKFVPDHMAKRIDRVARVHLCRLAGVSLPAKHQASAVIVGDIFHSSWGYDQTNCDFYQVVKTTPKMLGLRKIDKKLVKGRGGSTEYYMPEANKFVGPVLRKKLGEYQGKPYVKLTTYSSASKWDGKPKGQTGGNYGH